MFYNVPVRKGCYKTSIAATLFTMLVNQSY